MGTFPETFRDIPRVGFARSACSPEVPPTFRGLRLAAPDRILLPTPFPIAGTYQVGAPFLNRFYAMDAEIVIVAVDARAHVPRACNLMPAGQRPLRSYYDEASPDLLTVLFTGWFNLDLFVTIPDLPRQTARYHVFATIGDVVSNVVTVRVEAP